MVCFSRLEARFAKLNYFCNINFTVSMLRVSLKIPTLNQWNGKTYEKPILKSNMPITKIECQWMACIREHTCSYAETFLGSNNFHLFAADDCPISQSQHCHLHLANLVEGNRICAVLRGTHAQNMEVS